MNSDERMNSLASLKQSIIDSEASLRQMKQTIEVVDARLRRHDDTPNEALLRSPYLKAAEGGG